MSEGKRSIKIADQIRKEVSEMILSQTIKDPRIGFLTVTRVQVSDDCRMARIYFSVMGDTEARDRSLQGLNSAKGYVRREIGRRMGLRYTPDIVFQFDPSVEYAIQMEKVFQELHGEKEENDGD
jgi:ribosome-binding factor A